MLAANNFSLMTGMQALDLSDLPSLGELGERVSVDQYLASIDRSAIVARHLGQQVAGKLLNVFEALAPGEKRVIAEVMGLDLSTPLRAGNVGSSLVLRATSIRREIGHAALGELVRSQLDISLIDSRRGNRPHPHSKGALHLKDLHVDDEHVLRLEVEKLEGLGVVGLINRYPLLILERLLTPERP